MAAHVQESASERHLIYIMSPGAFFLLKQQPQVVHKHMAN